MQFELSILISASLGVFGIAQVVMVASFLRALRREVPLPIDDRQCPKVAVILCLRGSDPFLADCIRAILDQDYPRYDVQIVIDHADDPSREILDKVLNECSHDHVHIQFLTERRETCTLKCSSLVQVVSGLDESYDAIAQLDADTIAHRSWLKELVAPLQDPDVGATTGNRWYMPDTLTWGSMVRWLWNTAAVVQMHCYCIPWGGTLAVKLDVVRESDLLDRWAHAFCEDTMLASFLKQRGQRVVFVPSLLMVNRESCRLTDFTNWVSRQLLTARLYHPSWPLVAGHAVLSSGLMAAALVLIVWSLAIGDWESALISASGLAAYQGSNFYLLWRLELTASSTVRRRGESSKRFSWRDLLSLPTGVALTQVVYIIALLKAIFNRSVAWRGAVYRIHCKKGIQLVHDQPFTSSEDTTKETLSL